ncbi:MAG: GAF domain-containing protein [Myxococcales bacterium]|nr:GAF domain-containing protein [Myxococcales bacterium]
MPGPFSSLSRRAVRILPLPLEQELVDRVAWLVRLRWVAAGAVLLLTLLARPVLSLDFPTGVLLGIGVAILAYNAVFFAVLRVLRQRISAPPVVFGRFATLQILTDLVSLTLIVYFTGGLESPALFFFLFHVIIASILLKSGFAFLQVAVSIGLVSLMALLEHAGVFPHQGIEIVGDPADASWLNLMILLGSFTATVLVAAFLATAITRQLARRTRELAYLRQRQERDFEKMRILNEVAQAVSSSIDLERVLSTITHQATEVMNAKGCSVRLLDESSRQLRMEASFGLSPAYLNKGPIDAGRGLDRRVLSGEAVCIRDAATDSDLQYPEEAKREGIRSILSVPLRAQEQVIGVLRLYSAEERCFSDEEVDFLMALAAQGAVAIRNARTFKELELLERAKSRFIFTVSHDLKAPLAAIQSQLSLLTQGYAGDLNEQQHHVLQRTVLRAESLQALIRDLLALGAIQNRLPEKNAAPVDLGALLERLREIHQPGARTRGIRIDLSLGAPGVRVKALPEDMERLFGNLLENAVKYCRVDGAVMVRLERFVDKARVVVADTGIGIPPEALPRIFEEFYRAPNAKELRTEGTGLGLALCKRIVDLYGGEIRAESVLDQGSTFTVLLPALPPEAAAEAK